MVLLRPVLQLQLQVKVKIRNHYYRRGMYKIPLYQPPTDLNVKKISTRERIKDMYLCLRVTSGKEDKLALQKCNLGNKHLYLIPEIHTVAPVVDDGPTNYKNSMLIP